MKKALSALLALALLLVSCSAFADTVSWSTGSGFDITPESFKSYFKLFCTTLGSGSNISYDFNWRQSTKTERGYTVYTAKASGLDITLKMYVKDDKVHMVYSEFIMTSSANAKAMDSWLDAVSAASIFSLYTGEHSLSDILSAMESYREEMTSFSKKLSQKYSVSQYRSGIALKTKFCGYPYALEMSLYDTNTSSPKVQIKIYIVPASGKLTVI